MIQAWHFTGETLRYGRPIPPIGEWLEHDGKLELCESGLHASERLIDALRYAPGLTLHRATLDGEKVRGSDKLCGQRRRRDATVEVPFRAVVRLALESACLAAWCAGLYLPELLTALEAADREDWDAAGDATRNAAWAAAAARAGAAGDAAWAASRAAWAAAAARAGAAGDAAWSASRAAGAAAWAAAAARAAGDAAWAASRAAGAASWADAARAGAPWDAARAGAAWDAARAASRAAGAAAWTAGAACASRAAGAAAWDAALSTLEARAVALFTGEPNVEGLGSICGRI